MIRNLFTTILMFISVDAYADIENWYFTLNAGGADITNPSDVETVISNAENTYGTDRASVSVDFGFYWPILDNSLLLGLAGNNSADSVNTQLGTNVIRHSAILTGVSVIKYLSPEIGNGIFFRGDIGSASSRYTLLNNTFALENGSGSGILLGVGYGFKVSNESRLVLSLNTINIMINGDEYSSTQFMIGGLW